MATAATSANEPREASWSGGPGARGLGVQGQDADYLAPEPHGEPKIGADPLLAVPLGEEVLRIVLGVPDEHRLARRRHRPGIALAEGHREILRSRRARDGDEPQHAHVLVDQEELDVGRARDARRFLDDPGEGGVEVQSAQHELARSHEPGQLGGPRRHLLLEMALDPVVAPGEEIGQAHREADEGEVEHARALDDLRGVQRVVERIAAYTTIPPRKSRRSQTPRLRARAISRMQYANAARI